ncbi:MAG: lipoprotein-releasing ABC transporter permease subunit [Thermodesulfobacteriota bacterium]
MRFEWFVSLRYLKAKRSQGFISLITFISIGGVMLGVMALITVLGVMTGFSEGLRDKILGINSHIVVQSIGGDIRNYRELSDELRTFPGVTGATPYLFAQTMITAGEGGTGAILRGIDLDSVTGVLGLDKYVTYGTLDSLANPLNSRQAPVILGRELARHLRVSLGDSVRLLLADGPLTPIGVIPKMQTCTVAGIFESGMYEYDSVMAFVSLPVAQAFLDMNDGVHGIELKVGDIYAAQTIGDEIEKKLGPVYAARDWIETNRNLFSALKLEKTALSIIVALIVLVASFNIVSTLIMVVMEKNKDIAVLKSMGATSAAIMRIFVYEGLVIGFTGTVLGVAGGLAACGLLKRYQFIKLPDVYPLSTLPVHVVPADVVMIATAALIITLLATLYPSWQAARVSPAVTLRYE